MNNLIITLQLLISLITTQIGLLQQQVEMMELQKQNMKQEIIKDVKNIIPVIEPIIETTSIKQEQNIQQIDTGIIGTTNVDIQTTTTSPKKNDFQDSLNWIISA